MAKKIFFTILLIIGLVFALGGLFSLGGDNSGTMIFLAVTGIIIILIASGFLFSDKETHNKKTSTPGKSVNIEIARQVAAQIKNKNGNASGLLEKIEGEENRRETLSYAIKLVVDEFLEDKVLSEEEEETLNHFLENSGYDINSINLYEGITLFMKSSILRTVMNGDVPENVPQFQMPIRFNFLKSESLIYAFENTEYYKEVTRRHYEGGHQGFSVRLARGLYYRTGAFKGHPVEEKNVEYQDTGIMVLTTKHIYFGSYNNMFRVRYNKIVAFTPYDDGLGVMKDTQSAKPLIFKTGDGWFTYNLVINLAEQME